jgi:hypothetical protein
MKTCSTCGIEKEDILFRKNRGQCKECATTVNKKWHEENKEKDSKQRKARYENNKDHELSINREWHFSNEEKVKDYRRKWAHQRYNNDPVFRMRLIVSVSINSQLKSLGFSKDNVSCIKYLSYSVQELKDHIESLFEPWMTWENCGNYDSKTWKDDDQSTWTWQLDHIIPHSEFYYTSMEDRSFQDCWALSNLRPYSAKQNVIDGSTRARHKND